MSTFYWLEPGWTNALCGSCGCNIWGAGGDPDHGLCPSCWDYAHQQDCQQQDYQEYEPQPPEPPEVKE